MKKLFVFCALFFLFFNDALSQAWVMDEVYEETKSSDPITSMDVLSGVIFLIVVYCLFKIFTIKRKVSRKRYVVSLSTAIIVFVLSSVAIPLVSKVTLREKYVEMYDKTKQFVMKYSGKQYYTKNHFDYYGSIRQMSKWVTAVEIQDFKFYDFHDMRMDDFYMRMNNYNIGATDGSRKRYESIAKLYDHPYSDTVYSTYSLYSYPQISSWIMVSSKGEHLDNRLHVPVHENDFKIEEEATSPYIISFSIHPERIRYFKQEGDVQYDVAKSFLIFIDRELSFSHAIYRENDIIDDIIAFKEKEKNASFNILWSDKGMEEWGNKGISGYDEYGINKYVRSYFYDIVNYGDYEVMYGISDIKIWTIKTRWSCKQFLFWNISKDNWFDCHYTYSLCKYFLILVISYIFIIVYLVKLNRRVRY